MIKKYLKKLDLFIVGEKNDNNQPIKFDLFLAKKIFQEILKDFPNILFADLEPIKNGFLGFKFPAKGLPVPKTYEIE